MKGLVTKEGGATISEPRVVVFMKRGRAHVWLQRLGSHFALTNDPDRATIFSEARATELARIWGGDVREPTHPRDANGRWKETEK
jgi:hypothetical protein